MSTMLVSANLFDLEWETVHSGTTLPSQVRVKIKILLTHDRDVVLSAICQDVMSRYRVPLKNYRVQNLIVDVDL